MSGVHWLLQSNVGPGFDPRGMADLIKNEGHEAHSVNLERDKPVPVIPVLDDVAPIICRGPGFLTRAAKQPRFAAGVFFEPDLFRWSKFQQQWGEAMLSNDGRVMPLNEALGSITTPAFIRPDADSKAFDGGVVDREQLRQATRHLSRGEELQVVVASPMGVDFEWRTFIVDREVVAVSQYRVDGVARFDGPVPYRVIDFAIEQAAHWGPAPIYCLDVGQANGRLGLIEANCFNASRFYDADVGAVVRAVSDYVLRQLREAVHV